MSALPFPYEVIDFDDSELFERIDQEWPVDGWRKEDGVATMKWSREKLTRSTLALVDGIVASGMVGDLLGIKDLFHDPEFFGAGLHCIPRGGFLKMHVDFNQHPKGWKRRANCLVYLNRKWKPEWGGQLQLGLGVDAVRIDPIARRCVIFENAENSWHGHPKPLECPETVQRRSLAIYFYTTEPIDGEAHTTIYRRDS